MLGVSLLSKSHIDHKLTAIPWWPIGGLLVLPDHLHTFSASPTAASAHMCILAFGKRQAGLSTLKAGDASS